MNRKILTGILIIITVSVGTGCGNKVLTEPIEAEREQQETISEASTESQPEEAAKETEEIPLMVERLSEAAITNTISYEIKKKAESMPTATYKTLPDWNGTTIVNKMEYGWRAENISGDYTKEVIDEIAAEGFNFVRVPLDTRIFYTDSTGEPGPYFEGNSDMVNTKELRNTDDMISWCIDRGIHVCFDVHSTPGGYMIGGDEEASRELLFTEGSDEEQYFFDFWEFFSKRYADISPNALSFNLYNEPPQFVTDEQYSSFIKKTLSVTTPQNPDRIIFVDMLGYAREPVYGLVGEPVAQCFHCYDPYDFTHSGFDNMDYESGEANRRSNHREIVTYPLPAIYAGLNKGYVVTGDFKAGTKLTMEFSGGSIGAECILSDDKGNELWSETFDRALVEERGHEVIDDNYFSGYEDGTEDMIVIEYELTEDVSEISFKLNSDEAWLDMQNLIIETENYKAKLIAQWIDGIMEDLPGTRAMIDEHGIVRITEPNASKYDQGRGIFEEQFQKYVDFAKEADTSVMLQEFGDTVYTDISCAERFYDDILSVCDEMGINWVHWTFDGGDFSYVAADEKYKRHDATYEDLGNGRAVCVEMRNIFKAHCK
ncbi:MAG: cellulase family glycosylhydrolase [Lachnospiraceae bacterium]|nr:cellulase family glycosylhydrolase [Lachnospiraceae bacterium]